jgi:hypothetical protein
MPHTGSTTEPSVATDGIASECAECLHEWLLDGAVLAAAALARAGMGTAAVGVGVGVGVAQHAGFGFSGEAFMWVPPA